MYINKNAPKPKMERKDCYFCCNNIKVIDYKDVVLLRKFINTAGKILPRKKTGSCAKHQRGLAQSIKRSRIMGLLPFTMK